MQFKWHDDGGFTAWDDANCFCIGRDCQDDCCDLQSLLYNFLAMPEVEQQMMFGVMRAGLMLAAPQYVSAFDALIAGFRSLNQSQQRAIYDYSQRTIARRQ